MIKNIRCEENTGDSSNDDDGERRRSKKASSRRKNEVTSPMVSENILLEKSVAVRFLQRNDFLVLLQQNPVRT